MSHLYRPPLEVLNHDDIAWQQWFESIYRHLAGHTYGSMYAQGVSQLISITAAATWTVIPAGFSAGQNSAFAFQNSRELVCNRSGRYLVTYSLSLIPSASGDLASATIGVGGVAQGNLVSGINPTAGSTQFVLMGTGVVSLVIGDIVTMLVSNGTDADDFTMQHANLSLSWVGD